MSRRLALHTGDILGSGVVARLVLSALLLGSIMAVPRPAVAVSRWYERQSTPPPLRRLDRQLWRGLRQWSRAHNSPIRFDARLGHAAAAILRGAADSQHESQHESLQRAKRIAQRQGWTDGQAALVLLRGATMADVVADLHGELDKIGSAGDLNRAAVIARRGPKSAWGGKSSSRDAAAITGQSGEITAVVLLSRRLLRLLPVPSKLDGPSRVTISGTLGPEIPPTSTLTLVLGERGGATRRVALPVRNGAFGKRLRMGTRRNSIVDVQILLDRGQGPEIAANMPIGVGRRPQERPEDSALSVAQLGDGAGSGALASLIVSIRESQALPLPAQSAILSQIAQKHAEDMLAHGFFAHQSPTTGDLTARLGAEGIRFALALENIAAGVSPGHMVRDWMASPSHRSNLLHPEITVFGVGLAGDPKTDDRLYSVAILALPADHGQAQELANRAARHLNESRKKLGLERLIVDKRLNTLAKRHSREIAGGGRLGDRSPVRGSLVDTVFREMDVSEAATDVYLADSVSVVGRSSHLKEFFDRAGVGVYREVRPTGPQLWVTVIFARN